MMLGLGSLVIGFCLLGKVCRELICLDFSHLYNALLKPDSTLPFQISHQPKPNSPPISQTH